MPAPGVEAASFFESPDLFGDEIALVSDTGEALTYADLRRIADALQGHFTRKSLVFSLCDNSPESVAAYLGFLRARVVPVMLNRGIHDDLLGKLLLAYEPEFIWLPADRAANAAGTHLGAQVGAEQYRHGAYVLCRTRFAAQYPIHDDLAQLLATSGSTGSPVLVRQSYQNIAGNARAIAACLGIGKSDRPITTLPMSYTYGLSIICSHLQLGCTLLLTNKSLMDKGFWELLKGERATTFGGVPYTYEMLKKLRFARMDLPSLRYLTQAGGRLSAELSREFATVCREKGMRYITMYGQTEATARMSYLPNEHAEAKAGSIGIPIPGGRFHLEDGEGAEITEADAVGELVYRGDNVAMGLAADCSELGKGDENRGTLHTGDLARRDVDGFYYIAGRKKRMLKLFGNRVNLADVDAWCGELGFPAMSAGEDDHLRIYTTAAEALHHAEIRQAVAARMGIHPSAIDVVHIDEFPRNEAGKLLYSALP